MEVTSRRHRDKDRYSRESSREASRDHNHRERNKDRERERSREAIRDYTRNNNYEIDFNDISRASTPTSTFSSKSEGRKKEREHKYTVDDYKRKIARLKSELDLQKAKSKKSHKEKSAELREIRESYESQKQAEIDDLEMKLKARMETEKKQMEEDLTVAIKEEKDKELQQVLKYKDDEIKELKNKYKKEKESAIRTALENEKKLIDDKEKQLSDEIKKIKDEKEKLESEFKKKCAEESRKEKEFTKIKEEYDAELRRILGESKKVALGNMERLKKAEKALSEKANDSDDELNEVDFSELIADLQTIQSQTSSRAVSRSVSTTSELKLEEVAMNINTLLASPAVTPAMVIDEEESPSPLTVIRGNEAKARSSSAMSEPARDVFSRKQEERDRQLTRRVSELQTQTQRLERKIALLKTENETLKRRQDDKKPLEEKIKTLKKRNAELAAIARRLEEKAKHLQQENLKKTKEMTGQLQNQTGTDQMKKMFARQRAKDLAEHAKNMLSKDREIEELRKKCQELADNLSNSDFIGPENSEMYGEKEELVNIIKQAAKERLELERQLAVAKPGADSKVVSLEKYKELEETNETLQKEIQKLERAQSDTERLEIELTQKKLECERLARDIEEEKVKSKTLASELEATATQNSELATQVTGLHVRLQDLEKVNEECSTLRLHLSDAQHECEVAKGEVSVLQLKVQNLETVVKKLEFSTEKLKQVEKDYHETVLKLQEKQKEIDQLQKIQESAREKYEAVIRTLQEKVKGLEQKDHDHSKKQQELTEEVIKLRAQVAKKQTHEIRSTEIQTGKSIEFTPSATSSPNQSPTRGSPANHISRKSPANSRRSSKSPRTVNKSPATVKSPGIKASTTTPSSVTSVIVNRVKSPSQDTIQRTQATPIQTQPVIACQTLSKKLNGVLNDQTESTKSNTDTGFADDDEVTQANSPDPDKGDFDDPELFEIARKLKELEAESDSSEDLSKTGREDDSGMGSKGDHKGDKDISEMSLGDSRLSALAKKGPIQVYIAKYSYDPNKCSPNENPEAELPLHAGDYVLIYGDMDEDGFYDGELIDGRRGLVPSNFIEKVAEEDLPEFHAAVAMAGHIDEDSTMADSVQQDLDFDSGDETEKQAELVPDRLKLEVTSDLEDIEEEDEETVKNKENSARNASQTGAPFPKNLQLDRQLASSILVSWRPPDEIGPSEIRSYHVFLDGDFKTAIRGNERTKALLENVESRKIHRVSVRCISSVGQSHDNQCTILVGKEVIPAPFDLRVSDVTASSATISWTPGDSCLSHAISVNNVEIRVVKPGVFSHYLTGLAPATSHKVTIQAKNWTGKGSENVKPEKLMSSIEFLTTAGGAPDPPISIQVEAGPQEGTILVTWLPVTIDTAGFSNGALISGYVVYADGQKTKEVLGATNDHVILSSSDFHGFIPKDLVVRSFTKDHVESVDSEVVRLPQVLIKEITVGAAKTIASEAVKKKSPLHGLDAEEEIETAFKDINKVYEQNTILGRNYPEPFIDSSCSELSDIPEVDEVSSPEPTNENNPLKDTLRSLVNGLSGLSNESSDFEEIYQRNLTKEVEAEYRSASQSGKSSKPTDHIDYTIGGKTRSGNGRSPSPRNVPQIEITRENSFGVVDSSEDSNHKKLVKTNSDDKSSVTKVPSQENGESVSKYSANMDKRDGYRDSEDIVLNKSSDINSDINSKRSRSSSRGQNSPRGQGDTDRTTPRGVSSPGGGAGGRGMSPRNRSKSPSSRDSPKTRHSPRTRGSPGDLDRHHDNHNGHRDQHHRKSSASPSRNTHASPHRDRHSTTVSPLPSPISKSNPKEHGYRDDSNLSIDVISNKAQSDTLNQSDYDEGGDVDSISGEINPPIDDNRIRLFVALFDYDPETMSPNVDSLEEELPFREGQIIKVYGDKDADGFYRGECGGRVGYIPCNMVSEIQVDDPELEEQLLKEVQENGTVANSAVTAQLSGHEQYLKPVNGTSVHLSPSVNTLQPLSDTVPVRRMVALYDYDPQELSPNVDSEVELTFKSGEIIMIYGDMDEDGFYLGEIGERRGLVPSNFLQDAGVSDDEALDSVSVITPARSGESINTSDSRKSEKSEVNDKDRKLFKRKRGKFAMKRYIGAAGAPNHGFLVVHTPVLPLHPYRASSSSSRLGQQYQQRQSPRVDSSPTKMDQPKLDQVDFDMTQDDIGMSRPRSLTPDELKQKKKSGGFLSKGKNILKKFTR